MQAGDRSRQHQEVHSLNSLGSPVKTDWKTLTPVRSQPN